MDVCAKRVPQRLEVICVCVWVSAARRWAARGPLVAPLADWNEKHWQPGASLRLGLQAAVVKCERVTVWCVRKCEREKKNDAGHTRLRADEKKDIHKENKNIQGEIERWLYSADVGFMFAGYTWESAVDSKFQFLVEWCHSGYTWTNV